MFCPKCGNANQQENSYCRKCGFFLPDFDKFKTKEPTPEQNLKVNTVLSFLTGIVSISLAIALYAVFLGKESTPFIIYLTAGFLTAIFAWQVQVFWRSLLLKKQIKNRISPTVANQSLELEELKTQQLLKEFDTVNAVAPSITENTTRNLNKIPRK